VKPKITEGRQIELHHLLKPIKEYCDTMLSVFNMGNNILMIFGNSSLSEPLYPTISRHNSYHYAYFHYIQSEVIIPSLESMCNEIGINYNHDESIHRNIDTLNHKLNDIFLYYHK